MDGISGHYEVRIWAWHALGTELRCYMRSAAPLYRIEWTGANGKTYNHFTDSNLVWSGKHPEHELLCMKVKLSLC